VSQEARYYRVGLFVFVGIALLVAAVLLLGGGNAFKQTVILETSFDESVEGLDVGSPFKIRGVKRGVVKEISLARDEYRMPNGDPLPDEHSIDVVVRIEVTPTGPPSLGSLGVNDTVGIWVEKGLRVRLTAAGLTGVVYLEGDFWPPERYPAQRPPWSPLHVYIPAAPSALKAFTSAAERVLQRVEQVDVEGVLTKLNTLLTTMNDAADKLDLENVQDKAVGLMGDLQTTSASLRTQMDAANLGGTSRELIATLKQLSVVMTDIQQLVQAQTGGIASTLDNVRVMTENLRDLTETLRSYPSLLLLGEPPPEPKGGK
jgi:phospholipid/cholesterol/gamma-HCH transport system substrate-binding protein/paraquat-inducible protein B